jgi:DNA-binding transcriptional ArsR family regulator
VGSSRVAPIRYNPRLPMRDNKYTIIESYVKPEQTKSWTFLTNHAQVLICLAETHDIRLRDVAERIGITERATQRILADLVEAGYVKTIRVGRRNHYTVDHEHAMRHTAQIGHEIGALLTALSTDSLDDSSSDGRLKPNA